MPARVPTFNRYVRRLWVISVVALAFVITACGGGAGGGGGGVSVALDPTDPTMILGGSASVQVSVTRSPAATAALSLQAEGAPAWVSVDFDPPTLSDSNLESTMTISSDPSHPDADVGSFDLTVLAVGSGLEAQQALTLTVELLDVTGVVVDPLGTPLAGISVLARGAGSSSAVGPFVTDQNGQFTLSDMTVPYDLSVVNSDLSYGHAFIGLTTAAPRVLPGPAALVSRVETNSAEITGTLSHALLPLTADHYYTVCVEGLDAVVLGCDSQTVVGTETYDLDAVWSAQDQIEVRVRAYLYEVDADGVPTNIVAAGMSGTISVSDGDAEALNLSLSDTTSQASMSVTTEEPSGYSLQSRVIATHYAEFGSFGFGHGFSTDDTDTIIAPFFAGAPLSAVAIATADDPLSSSSSIAWSTGHVSGDSTTLTFAVPPTSVVPPDAVADVSTSTVFSVANPEGGVLTYVFTPDSSSGPAYAVTTVENSATIPDLSAMGMGLPGAADYDWFVAASHDVLTVDGAVTGDGYLLGYFNVLAASTGGAGLAPESDGRISATDSRSLTTQ